MNTSSQVIGWQGLSVVVPEDWTVGAVEGDHREGYLRVDGPDFPRLEVRWSEAGKTDLDKTVQRYLQQLTRTKSQVPVETDDQTRFISRRKVGKDQIRPFLWRGENAGYGVGWICKCGRLVLAQVLGDRDEPGLEALAVEILSHLEDHARQGWNLWSLYDLSTELPEGFQLTKTQLRAGLTELTFDRKPERVVTARWGMAETALRGTTLRSWAVTRLWKALRNFRPNSEEFSFRGHEGLRITGEAAAPLGMAVRLGKHLVQQSHADQLVGYVWHCAPSNRIYVVYGMVDVTHRDLLDQIRDRTICHE